MEVRKYVDSLTAARLLGVGETSARWYAVSGKSSVEKVAGKRAGTNGVAYAFDLDDILQQATMHAEFIKPGAEDR